MDHINLSHQHLCDALFSVGKNDRNVSHLMNYVKEIYPDLHEEKLTLIKEKLDFSFLRIFEMKFKAAFYNEDQFRKKNHRWLLDNCVVEFQKPLLISGRPSIHYEDGSKSTKRRRTQSLADEYSEEEIKQAFFKKLRVSGKKHLIKIIENLLIEDDSKFTFTETECLALIEDAKLSRWQYDTIRKQCKEKNADIFIPYKQLTEERQKCYPTPSNISVSEKGVKINLQALLDHTCLRLLQVPSVFSELSESGGEISLTMTSKWGCDGASDQGQYKQRFSDGSLSDNSIFMSSMVPLTLSMETTDNITTNDSKCVWKNPQCGSTRFCRVISFEFAKETTEKTTEVVNEMRADINALKPTTLEIERKKIKVHHILHLTMIDGKVEHVLTDTSSCAVCSICKASPKEMNDLRAIENKDEIVANYDYGMSSLHAWIRFMENILHIAYRLAFEKWCARSAEEKNLMKLAKAKIQKQFKEKTGLLVDYPKQGSGSSNDGNTARRFFRDPHLASQITGVDRRLIERYGIVLQTLACGMKIDTEKFSQYCKDTAKLYVSLYDWFYMPSSVHKVLIHGSKIIENFALIPIGMLSEEAQESRNKDIKHYRKFNTRKCSRIATNTDLIHKLLLSSDPYISSFRHKMKNTKLQIDKAAKSLLLSE